MSVRTFEDWTRESATRSRSFALDHVVRRERLPRHLEAIRVPSLKVALPGVRAPYYQLVSCAAVIQPAVVAPNRSGIRFKTVRGDDRWCGCRIPDRPADPVDGAPPRPAALTAHFT